MSLLLFRWKHRIESANSVQQRENSSCLMNFFVACMLMGIISLLTYVIMMFVGSCRDCPSTFKPYQNSSKYHLIKKERLSYQFATICTWQTRNISANTSIVITKQWKNNQLPYSPVCLTISLTVLTLSICCIYIGCGFIYAAYYLTNGSYGCQYQEGKRKFSHMIKAIFCYPFIVLYHMFCCVIPTSNEELRLINPG